MLVHTCHSLWVAHIGDLVAFLVGTKLSRSGILFGFTSDLPYEVTRLKSLWFNLWIEFPHCLEFGGFFLDPGHILDFVYCFEFYPHIFFILLLLEQ